MAVTFCDAVFKLCVGIASAEALSVRSGYHILRRRVWVSLAGSLLPKRWAVAPSKNYQVGGGV